MKFFQKRAVAAVVLILAIVAGVVIGQAKKPDTGGQASTAIVGSYTYVYDYAGVLTDETMEHIDAMNASLFAQTGAQILVSVVNSTGGADIMDYASDLGNSYGVGSAERNNGVVMLLALDNISQSGLMGDYCVVVGAGLESHADDFMSLQSYYLENDFAAGEYDAGVKATFDAFIAWFADFYGVTIREGYIPAVRETYSSGSGDDSLDHLQQGDVAEDLGFGHAQDLACLLLALRHSLDAAPVDLGEVAGVIDDEGHTHGHHPPGLTAGPVEPLLDAGHIEQCNDLQHQRRAPDDPDHQSADEADGPEDDEGPGDSARLPLLPPQEPVDRPGKGR